MRFLFGSYLSRGQRAIQAKDLFFGLKERVLFSAVNLEIYGKDRVTLMGPNGSGKTTLIKVLLGEIKAAQGKIKLNPSVKVGYLPQEISFKDKKKTVLEEFEGDLEIPENEVRKILGRFLFSGEDQIKKLNNLSLGEKRRLYLSKIVASGANFLVLDEPTNHLDISSIEAVEKALVQFEGAMLIISHDRYFLRNIGIEKFYYLKEGKFRELHSLEELGSIMK